MRFKLNLTKKQKVKIRKIFTIIMFTAAGLFVLTILAIVFTFMWDRHQQERQFNEALKKCGNSTYEITFGVDFENVGYWDITRVDKFHYALLDSVMGYACSAQDAKNKILKDHPGVPEEDLRIQIYN